MKATILFAMLLFAFLFAACGELLPTEPASPVTQASTPTDTREAFDRRGMPNDPNTTGFTDVKLVVNDENKLELSWKWNGKRPERFGIFLWKEGFEPDPEFGVPGDQTTFEYAPWPWNQPTARLAVAARLTDSDGTIRWAHLTLSNEVTGPGM